MGAAGWAGIEIANRYVEMGLNRTAGTIRVVAETMVAHAEDSLHWWLNCTLIAGVALVVLGVLGAVVGGVARTSTAGTSPGTAVRSR